MRWFLWVSLRVSLLSLLANVCFGQRPGGTSIGLPPLTSIPPLGPTGPRPSVAPQRAYPFPFGLGFGYGAYDYRPAPAPNVTIVQQPPPYVIVQAPPPAPVRSAITEYKGPATAAPVLAGEEPPAFAIVFKDGSTRSAAAVTAEGNVLHYVDPDGEHRRAPLDSVDREATRRANRERKLVLHLPPSTNK